MAVFVQDADGNYLADVVIDPIIDDTEFAHKLRELVDDGRPRRLQDAESRDRTTLPVAAVSEPSPDDRYDLVVVPVRAEQLERRYLS